MPVRLLLTILITSCGSASGAASTTPEPEPVATVAAEEPAATEEPAASEPEPQREPEGHELEFPLASCVGHAGSRQADSTGRLTCNFNAECIENVGGATVITDGFIYLSCDHADCTCRRERIEGELRDEWSVTIEGACDDAPAALWEHCSTDGEQYDSES